MPTLDQLRDQGRVVQQVIAERLGLDPAEITSLGYDADPGGGWVEWTSRRKVDRAFLADCLTEAARRIDAQEDQP